MDGGKGKVAVELIRQRASATDRDNSTIICIHRSDRMKVQVNARMLLCNTKYTHVVLLLLLLPQSLGILAAAALVDGTTRRLLLLGSGFVLLLHLRLGVLGGLGSRSLVLSDLGRSISLALCC